MNKPALRRLTAFLKTARARRVVVAVGAIGIVLILLSELLPAKKTEETAALPPATAKTAEEYAAELEARLCEMMSGMAGVGRCRVMVTLENGVEYVYASEQKVGSDYSTEGDRLSQADDTESSVILVQTEGGYEGLLVTELQPTVRGVVVVCEGGGDTAVQARVTEAVTTVLNITAKRVCVVAGDITEERQEAG